MLLLLTAPAWAPPGQTPAPLPLTLPAALLVVLAAQPGWMAREALALIFWPDAAPADALHHLRVNLHRARQLATAWGQPAALQSERSRVRLDLPTDVAQFRQAVAARDATALARLGPRHWLEGWRLPGHDGFNQWCEDLAQGLQTEWLAASRAMLPAEGRAPAKAPGTAPPGRDTEWHRLLASPAPALLLLGEAGAGKSTLLKAAYPQAPCLHGLEGLQAMPYRPILDALRSQAGVLERALREPSHPLRPYRLDLARMLPELAPDEALPPLDALTAQTRLVEALARAFEALTPLLLVDDIQWCDSATVQWLLMLAHSGRLRWRATARRHEMPPAVADAMQSLRAASRLEDLELLPFDHAALAQACAVRWPQRPFTAEQLDKLHALSGGNAFLVGELVSAGLPGEGDDTAEPVRHSVARLVMARIKSQPDPVRAAVEAAAVFVHAVPAQALQHLIGSHADETQKPDSAWAQTLERAIDAGLLRQDDAGLACRHDLIRKTVLDALPPARRNALHRHAALWLAGQAESDALTIAEHWRAAGEPQTALAWSHQGAEQLKARGRFDEAKALWRLVADESLDAAQALRARLELAACDLFEDLDRGEAALEAVRAQLAAVANAEQHRQLESRALAALVDNRVFAGDSARARQLATRLRELLPALPAHDQVDPIEVLIELAMREPDIPAAWALLAQLRSIAPRRPTLLSFEGQIHWFGGQVQAAHNVLARLLDRHPDYCRGITVENDLAVMLHALGRIDEAETMARRSLQSWAGVAHTETLSLLVLGVVLTSAGRYAEADTALLRALAMAQEQASPGFEAEALVRRARALLRCNREDEAQTLLNRAGPLLANSLEPLRVSQLVLAQVQAAAARGQDAPQGALARLQAVALRSAHPLVHARLALLNHALAVGQGDASSAARAADDTIEIARRAGLMEVLAEGLLLKAECTTDGIAARGHAHAALDLATRHGLAWVRAGAQRWLARHRRP